VRIVVTGSAGRIGRAIATLLAEEHEVVGIDRLPAATVGHRVADLLDRRALAAAFEGADAVVHAAALHAPHVGAVPDADFERVNVVGTEHVIEAARAAGARRIVFTSTTALYGSSAGSPGAAAWLDEASEPRPLTIYHRTKLAAEARLRDASSDRLQVRVLRMSRCFPEPADLMAVYRLHRGVDARDVADAHAAALDDEGDPYRVWIVSGATPFRRSDLEALGRDAPAVLRERAPDLVDAFEARGWPLPPVIDRVYDPTCAMRDLAWRPRHGFDEVLAVLDRGEAEVLPPRGAPPRAEPAV
jgi:nucleoside-diphosphate-sugar epimerase